MEVFPKTLLQPVPNRFANRGDPVAAMDSNDQSEIVAGNPHSLSNFTRTSATNSAPGYENPDHTVTLFE